MFGSWKVLKKNTEENDFFMFDCSIKKTKERQI